MVQCTGLFVHYSAFHIAGYDDLHVPYWFVFPKAYATNIIAHQMVFHIFMAILVYSLGNNLKKWIIRTMETWKRCQVKMKMNNIGMSGQIMKFYRNKEFRII